jgi:hypothetical protein
MSIRFKKSAKKMFPPTEALLKDFEIALYIAAEHINSLQESRSKKRPQNDHLDHGGLWLSFHLPTVGGAHCGRKGSHEWSGFTHSRFSAVVGAQFDPNSSSSSGVSTPALHGFMARRSSSKTTRGGGTAIV